MLLRMLCIMEKNIVLSFTIISVSQSLHMMKDWKKFILCILPLKKKMQFVNTHFYLEVKCFYYYYNESFIRVFCLNNLSIQNVHKNNLPSSKLIKHFINFPSIKGNYYIIASQPCLHSLEYPKFFIQ